MQPPEKPRNVSYFIDRMNYSRNFLKLLQDDRIIDIVADTEATYGTGKTTILSDLYQTVQQAGGHHPMWLSLNLYSAWYMTPALAEREKAQHDRKLRYSLPILVQNYISFHRLLVELAGSLHLAPDAEARLNRLSLDLLDAALPGTGVQVEGTVEQWRKLLDALSAGGPPQPGTLSEPQAEALIETAVQATTGYVLTRYNDSYGQQRNVLFADDYCWISDQRIGTWVIKGLAQQMQNTVLIVSHSENVAPDERLDHLLDGATRSIQPLFLTNFTPEEVGEYLEKRLPRYVAEHPGLPDAAYYFSEGHAQTVCLMADLLEYADTSRIPDFAQLIGVTAQSPAQLIRHLARHLLEKTSPVWLREALEIGALARRFDGVLMHSVLQANADYIAELHSRIAREAGVPLDSIDFEALAAAAEDDEDPDDEATAGLLAIRQQVIQAMIKDVEERLERYSFINFHSISDYGPYFAYHSLVRDQMAAALREDRGADHLLGLHQRIVDYYQQVLKGYEEQGDTDNVYVQCYRYEDPIWQSRMSEWLYHLACVMDLTADDDPEAEARRHAVQFEFLNVYMSAWQWWGWYLDFPFNNQVLNGWKSILTDEGDPVYALVARFHEIYPRGFFVEKIGSPHWDEVQAILESLIERFDLHMERDFDPETEEDALWLTMQVMEFYASCFRFRRPDPDFARAEAIYRRSIVLSEVAEDPFNKTYYHAFLADMYLEMGRFDDAIPEAEVVIEMVGDYRDIDSDYDYEVLSMAHLALGHVAYEQARFDDAASAYIDAIASAYLSNFLPLGIPPDPYTSQWAKDIAASVSSRLLAGWQAGQQAPSAAILRRVSAAADLYHTYREVPRAAIDAEALLAAGDQRAVTLACALPEIDSHDPYWFNPAHMRDSIDAMRRTFDALEAEA